MQVTDGVKEASQTQVDLSHLICSAVKAQLCISSAASHYLMNTAGFTLFVDEGMYTRFCVCVDSS